MIFKAPPISMSSRVRYTFHDPQTGERIPAINTETGEEVWGGEWHNNMITDRGLDDFAFLNASGTADRRYLSLSQSLTEIKEPSGAITAEQSGDTVTASAAFFTANDVGRAIVWADTSNARITAYNSPTSVTVDKAQTVPAQTFERWHVDLAVLPGAVDPSNDTPESPSTESWFDGGYAYHMSRVSRVATLSQNRNITGFGLGPDTGGTTQVIECFRDASGNPIAISMLAGKAVRVDSEYIRRVSLAPKQTPLTIHEYDAANQLIDTHIIDADFWIRSPTHTEPSHAQNAISLATPSTSFTSTNLGLLSHAPYVPGDPGTTTQDNLLESGSTQGNPPSEGSSGHIGAYTPGRRARTYEVELGAARQVGIAHGWAFRSNWAGANTSTQSAFILQFRDGATFEKADTHTLRLGWEVSWDRDYTVS